MSPTVLAQRMESAARAVAVLDALVNADLGAAGLPPQGAALVAGKGGADDWDAAVTCALWWLDVMQRAGLADAARMLYEAAHRPVPREGERAWLAREMAAREVARRAVAHAAAEAEAHDSGDDDGES